MQRRCDMLQQCRNFALLLRPSSAFTINTRSIAYTLSVVLTFKRFDAKRLKIRQPFSCARMTHAPGTSASRSECTSGLRLSASSTSLKFPLQRRIAGRDLKSFNSVDKPQHFFLVKTGTRVRHVAPLRPQNAGHFHRPVRRDIRQHTHDVEY